MAMPLSSSMPTTSSVVCAPSTRAGGGRQRAGAGQPASTSSASSPGLSAVSNSLAGGDVVWAPYRNSPRWPAQVRIVYGSRKVTFVFFPLPASSALSSPSASAQRSHSAAPRSLHAFSVHDKLPPNSPVDLKTAFDAAQRYIAEHGLETRHSSAGKLMAATSSGGGKPSASSPPPRKHVVEVATTARRPRDGRVAQRPPPPPPPLPPPSRSKSSSIAGGSSSSPTRSTNSTTGSLSGPASSFYSSMVDWKGPGVGMVVFVYVRADFRWPALVYWVDASARQVGYRLFPLHPLSLGSTSYLAIDFFHASKLDLYIARDCPVASRSALRDAAAWQQKHPKHHWTDVPAVSIDDFVRMERARLEAYGVVDPDLVLTSDDELNGEVEEEEEENGEGGTRGDETRKPTTTKNDRN